MSGLFLGCSKLKTLPNISKWNIHNVTDISSMFAGSYSFISLFNGQKYNISYIEYLDNNLSSSLMSLPDISKWDTSNVKNMREIFATCDSLKSLPNIFKWKTSEVKYRLYYIIKLFVYLL